MSITETRKPCINYSSFYFAKYLASDLVGISNAIAEARQEKNKPTLIRLRTTIGYGSKQQGTHGVHGARKYFEN
jgi:transketolase